MLPISDTVVDSGKVRTRCQRGISWRWAKWALRVRQGKVAAPIARLIARRTGRSEAKILARIGAAFLAVALIDFLRSLDAVLVAGRTVHKPANDGPENI
jgi:hypothetical protein